MNALRATLLGVVGLVTACNLQTQDTGATAGPAVTDGATAAGGGAAANGRGGGGAAAATNGATTTATGSLPAVAPSSPDKVELGRLLFWDPILSGERDVACASCHHPDFGYSDGKSISVGTGGGLAARNALTILDTAFNGVTAANPTPNPATAPMFWDLRASSLESQAKGPIAATAEMLGPSFDATTIFPELVTRLSAIPEYASRFDATFGSGGLVEDNIAGAIAAFERTLVDTGSSYDRFTAGDTNALTAAQQRGLAAFNNGGCNRCHSGPMFSDYKLHNVLDGAVRTPSLRNVTRTAPYFDEGALATLDQVFNVYQNVDQRLDPLLRGLRAPNGGARNDVAAFLDSLSDGTFDRTVPTSVPSGLTVGGRHP